MEPQMTTDDKPCPQWPDGQHRYWREDGDCECQHANGEQVVTWSVQFPERDRG